MNARPYSISAHRRRLPGYTFLEILVVLIILGLIASIVGVQLFGEVDKSMVKTTKIQIKSLEAALDLYRLHNSSYPTGEQGLAALLTRPELGRIPKDWQGPYLNANTVPMDGWKNPFIYESDGKTFIITSLGADETEGGTDLDADISNKNL